MIRHLVVWNDDEYIFSFAYTKDTITTDDLKYLDSFLAYHELRYTIHDNPHIDEKNVNNIQEMRNTILDMVKSRGD